MRSYRQGDDAELYQLGRLAFGGPREPEPDMLWSAQPGWTGLVAERDGAIVGSVKVREYRQFFGGAAVPMGGLANVAVHPHARGGGVATAMLDAVLPHMRERGQVISALFPSVPPLYRTRGWEQTGDYERATLRSEALALLGKPAKRPVMRRATRDDLPALADAYRSVASTVDGMLDRATAAFQPEKVLDLDIVDIVPGVDGSVLGYVSADRPDGERLLCHDLVARDRDTALGLLASLGSWSGLLDEVSLRIVDPAWWQLLVTLPVLHDVRNHPWMLRVVDLPAAVAARGWPAATALRPSSVDIEVVDEHAPWHSGRHRLVVEDGTVTCEPGGTGAVRLQARALGPWFAGSADTAMLRRAGLLDADPADARLLDLLTGAPHPCRMADSF
ncbi:GNAT family N-acetyltransferase [Actinophytocola gossypii]|uniref:GNAT family N-acetyltransferase n=1 Tax=Actinophytocola gossypii TaxID=2812003 RepID=A0ABT2J621_9PSEU|nr:GNAT family N-acetyltransferase [Actinophytocola gossypii]MCT2582940.1 GNAT family N-acetyltransferase [Actinophytocola gossypii]